METILLSLIIIFFSLYLLLACWHIYIVCSIPPDNGIQYTEIDLEVNWNTNRPPIFWSNQCLSLLVEGNIIFYILKALFCVIFVYLKSKSWIFSFLTIVVFIVMFLVLTKIIQTIVVARVKRYWRPRKKNSALLNPVFVQHADETLVQHGKGEGMGIIRKLAVRGYSNELKQMINDLSKLSTEQVAHMLILAVWSRANLDIEGNLRATKNENGELNPELYSYPILLKEIEKWISIYNEKGFKGRSFAFSIWVHTLRSIIRPELSDIVNRMWDILMRSKPNWERVLTQFRDEDIRVGISHDEVLRTERHAKAILQCLPPKQLS